MELQDLINKGVCGAGSLAGFNTTKGCPYNFKNTVTIWRTPADFTFDPSEEFNQAYLESLQLQGKLSIVNGITDFPEGGTDPLIESLPDGTEIDAGDAKYKYSPVFAQDLWLNKQLGSLEGQGNNRFIFLDSAGNILMTKKVGSGTSRGFLTTRTKRGKVILQTPGVGAKQTLEFQLASARELEDNFVMINQELLDFDPLAIEPIVQANVTFSAVPSAGDTKLSLSVVVDRGNKGFITGLDTVDDFKVSINGVTQTSVASTAVGETYEVTTVALVASDKIETSINGVRQVLGDSLYVSNKASKTVV